jgi:hypothetical protein
MGSGLLLGQLPGLFRRPVLVGGVVLLFLGALAIRWRSRGEPGDQTDRPADARRWSRPALGALAAIAAVGLTWDRVPPVFFDTLAYHFAQPNLWLIDGRIAPQAWSLVSWFPPGMSILYGFGLAWAGDAAANDANLLTGLLLLGLAADLARRLWGRPAGIVALGLLAALPITVHALAIPAADLAYGMFGFGSLGAWLCWRREGDDRWLWRAGLLAAGAALSKYLALLMPVGLGGVLFLAAGPAGAPLAPPARRLGRAGLFIAPTVILLLPWLAANFATVGNPVAPVLASLLPTRGLADGGLDAFYSDALGGVPGVDDLQALYPRLIAGDAESEGIYPTPAWGWFPVLLLLGLIPWERRDPGVRSLLGVASVTFAIWLLTFRWERFLLATSALMAVALAGAVVCSWRRAGLARIVTGLSCLLALLGVARASLTVLRFTGGLPVAIGREAPEAFTERAFPFAAVFREAARRLDPDRHHVLMVGETRHHWLDLPHTAPTVFNVHPLVEALGAAGRPREVTARLRRAGFTHLVVDPGWVQRSAERYPSLREAVDSGRLAFYIRTLERPLFEERGVALYALDPLLRADRALPRR